MAKKATTAKTEFHPTPEQIAMLCAVCTLSVVVDTNDWASGLQEFHNVNTATVRAACDALDEQGVLSWIQAKAVGVPDKAQRTTAIKKSGSEKVTIARIDAIRAFFAAMVAKKNPALTTVKTEVSGFIPWARAMAAFYDAPDYDEKFAFDLMTTCRPLRKHLKDPTAKRAFSTMAREQVVMVTDDDDVVPHDNNPPEYDDSDDTTPAPEPVKPPAKPEPAKPTAAPKFRVAKEGDGILWSIQKSTNGKDWETVSKVANRLAATQSMVSHGVTQLTASALASVIPDTAPAKKSEPPAPPKPKPAPVLNPGKPLSLPEIEKAYGVDPNQAKVVKASEPVQVVSAAAGSGKTSSTVRKIQYLIDHVGVPPSRIKVMAFNKHAAKEVKLRLESNIGREKANAVYPQTTHSFCLSEMRAWSEFHREGCSALVTGSASPWGPGKYLTPGPVMVRQAWDEALKRLDLATEKSDGRIVYPKKEDIECDIGTLKRWIGKSKNEGMTLTDFMASEWDRREDQRVQILMAGLLLYEDQKGMLEREKNRGDKRTDEYVEYFLPPPGSGIARAGDWDTKTRKAMGRLDGSEGLSVRFDFDDMLNEFLIGITPLPTDDDRSKKLKAARVESLREDYTHWMVDEAQDLSPVQHKIFDIIARNRKGDDGQYTLIGDPDQSIYAFKGSTPESFVEAEKDSESLSIPINYRSRKEIVELADKLVGHNSMRIDRKNVAKRPGGGNLKVVGVEDYETVSQYVSDDIASKLSSGGYLTERGVPRFSIICRTNRELDAFEDELAIKNITYVRRGGRPFWLKDDVGATTALMALGYHIAGKMKLEPREQLEYLGRAFKFPNRPGAPGSSSGQSGKFYLKPIATSSDPIGTLLSVSASDVSGRPGTGEAVVAFAKDIRKVAAAANGGPVEMMRAMLQMESTGYDGQTFADLMLEAAVKSDDDSELQDTAADSGGDGDAVEGVSTFSKLFRFYEYNKFSTPEQFVQACVESTNRSTLMQAKVQAKKDDASLEAVNLSTIHMTKGLEYENVYSVMNKGKFPSEVFPTDDLLANRERLAKYAGADDEERLKNMKLEEERRLAYVAITRATEAFTVFTTSKDLKGAPASPSQFIEEMGLKVEQAEPKNESAGQAEQMMSDLLRGI